MLPVLKQGDDVLVDLHSYRHRPPAPGEIVVARHPYRADVKLIKRVVAVDLDGSVRLAGLNPAESTDSRHFGAVPVTHVLGRVTSRLR